MAVTKQTYTLNPTWTASGLADLFRSAFIDAGLMTEWYDSFLSGSIQNRILEITYDGAKTYGKTYYWFMFTTAGVYFHVATGWNAGTHVPAGTQYLDYYSTATNSTANHNTFVDGFSASLTVTLRRYTSAIDTAFSVFYVACNSGRMSFFMQPGSHPVPSWVNLNHESWSCLIRQGWRTGGKYSQLFHIGYGGSRRHCFFNSTIDSATTSSMHSYEGTRLVHMVYELTGTEKGDNARFNSSHTENNGAVISTSTNLVSNDQWSLRLARASNTVNPALPAEIKPIFTNLPYSIYLSSSIPADFGLAAIYDTWSQVPGQTLQVSAGTEEWEIVNCLEAGRGTTVYTAKGLFVARTI